MLNVIEKVKQITGEDRLQDYLHYHYKMQLKDVKPVSGVLKLETDKGVYALKRVLGKDKNRLDLLYEYKKFQKSKNRNIKNILFPKATRNKKPYFDGYKYSYALFPWIDSKPITLNKLDDFGKVAESLAIFHNDSKDFEPSFGYQKLDNRGKWKKKWAKELNNCQIASLAAKMTPVPTKVDEFWTDISSYIIAIMENLLEYYQKNDCELICKESSKYSKIAHCNLNKNNILVQDLTKKVFFADLNKIMLDVRSCDIADWIFYSYGKTGKKEVITAILKAYQNISKLDENEYLLIYARLFYPCRLIEVINAVYNEGSKDISMVSKTISKLIKIENNKLIILKDFLDVLEDDFNISIPYIDWIK